MQLSLARTVVWYSITQQDSDMWLASGLELISDMITLRQALTRWQKHETAEH